MEVKNSNLKLKKEYKITFHNSFCAINWLANDLGLIQGRSKLPLPLEKIHLKFFKIIQSRGKAEAIKYLKHLRANVYQLLSWSKDGVFTNFPKPIHRDLIFLKSGEKFDSTFIKLLLTTLSLSRMLRTEANYSFSSIKGLDERKCPLPLSNNDCKKFWLSLGYDQKRRPSGRLKFRYYHRSTKAGPNGHALRFCMNDFLGLLENPGLLDRIKTLGGPRLSFYVEVLQYHIQSLKILVQGTGRSIRKLVAFSDPEGKTREVAILDYFSQACLRPLHNYLFEALKKIRQDCTFDQQKHKTLLEGSEIYYSIDLTAFTDRFPVLLNHKLLKSRIGKKLADSWLEIMTQPFESVLGQVSYTVGNPMGAYSSWNSTALAHHAIVWKACRNQKVDWKTLRYALLGDDLVIGHREVALEYCRLIRQMGVHWSKEKTHVSPHFYEFAKRIHWNGNDVTPFPIAALLSEIKNGPIGLVSVHNNATDKGWFSSNDGVSVWKGLFENLQYRRKYCNKLLTVMDELWKIISILQGRISALELLPFVENISPIVSNIISQRENCEEILNNLLVNSIMLLFVESFEAFQDTRKGTRGPLGLVAEQLTMYLTSLEDSNPDLPIWSLPESLPHTHVWGVISEEYLKSQRKAYLIDTIHQGNWDKKFKNILMPEDDSNVYFKVRSSDSILVKSPQILKIFRDNIIQLSHYPQLI